MASDADAGVVVGDVGPETCWREALRYVSVVVHLAARTHVLRETATDSMSAYRRVNVKGTERLARAAVEAGVKRMVFVSSIKVNGERTETQPLRETDEPRPEDAYGKTKWEAEQTLWRIAERSELEVTVLRPPLVYGPGVKGNFLALVRAIDKGLPLPLASVNNKRSLIYVGNLVSAIIACVRDGRSSGQTFLVSDGEDVSTPEIIRRIAHALGRRPRVFPIPLSLLRMGGRLLGKGDQVARLTDSLQLDNGFLARELGWLPPYTLDHGIAETVRWYRSGV
jgi:nucleoside-diphosphate-sugar epimerase